ncbi:uncharacterized protein N7511_001651 [Penicillium nucicola]|uniref:uncharacterized protein n=1 Tax=Penicillium nucicola TaxID=1850975 RepID=UPI002544D876|nr:uncharacterized protein N7511_001651 [Penicillium nucicola]KAJ5776640.1 hypothetical protein N7511_001651 [Penicillium nucicola]
MRGGSWFLALVGASAIQALALERETPTEFGLRVEHRGILRSAKSRLLSIWDGLSLSSDSDHNAFKTYTLLGTSPENPDILLRAPEDEVYYAYNVEGDDSPLATKEKISDGDEIEISTELSSDASTILEKNNTDEAGVSRFKKSVGSQIGEEAGLRLSFAIFIIWAFFC